MRFIKDLIDHNRIETALLVLGLSWLTNPVFVAIFLALVVYYYHLYNRSKKRMALIIPNFRYYPAFL